MPGDGGLPARPNADGANAAAGQFLDAFHVVLRRPGQVLEAAAIVKITGAI